MGWEGGLQTLQTWQCFQLITSQVVDNYHTEDQDMALECKIMTHTMFKIKIDLKV